MYPLHAHTVGLEHLPATASFWLVNPVKQRCMDSGGGTTSGATRFRLAPCDPSNPNQVFKYNPDTLQIYNPNTRMCMDQGASVKIWVCDGSRSSQRFVYVMSALLLMAYGDTNTCVDDGGGVETFLRPKACAPTPERGPAGTVADPNQAWAVVTAADKLPSECQTQPLTAYGGVCGAGIGGGVKTC